MVKLHNINCNTSKNLIVSRTWSTKKIHKIIWLTRVNIINDNKLLDIHINRNSNIDT